VLLESWVAGRWRTSDDEGLPLVHAATGEEVARLSTTPVPVGDALDFARGTGGPALRALTFHERAAILKSLALHLMERKDELYEISYATGSTAKDSLIDVDGGFGTLLAYASRGRRELPAGNVYVDGPLEQLGRTGSFVGGTCSPRCRAPCCR
jgi:oxepin-CoA hydrolase/3-oxo-5,6-dehydrosuberyl-CoA semialdehyde dehydrogenase